jgi:lysine/ornithine N-monooxygenase
MEIDDDDNMRKHKAKEDEDEKGKSKKKRKNKKEDTNELDELLKAKPDVNEDGEIFSEDTMKFVYKILYDNVSKDYNSISLDDLWNVVKMKNEAKKTYKINTRNTLLDVLFQIEKEGKIFISEDKEITIV